MLGSIISPYNCKNIGVIFMRFAFAFLIFFLTLPSITGFAGEEMFLKDNFLRAKPGDYIVTMYNKSFTILHIYSKNENYIVIEELTVPSHKFPKGKPLSWSHWLKEGGEHHTSWVMYDVDLSNAKIREFYSFSRSSWLEVEESDSIFTTLLSLPFELIPKKYRRKQGPPPPPGDLDRRSIWNPRMTVEGRTIKDVYFEAWKTTWPKDGSELAGKIIEIFLPEDRTIYPAYYPFWLQVRDALGTAKVRVVDSGTKLVSPKHSIPRRPPEIVKQGNFTEEGLVLTIKSPIYYQDFLLLALPENSLYKPPISLKCTTKRNDRDPKATLFVEVEELTKKLGDKQFYRFLIVPKEFDEIWTETNKPILWNP
jgi:hypothetical protein